jgi:hypothetical protein
MLGFAWFYSPESGLFNGFMSKKIKKIDSRLKLCAKRLKRAPALDSPLHSSPCPDPASQRAIAFSDSHDKIARNSVFHKEIEAKKRAVGAASFFEQGP